LVPAPLPLLTTTLLMTLTPTQLRSVTMRSSSWMEYTSNDNLIVIGVSPTGRVARLASSGKHSSMAI
jgi:hypothetical protein